MRRVKVQKTGETIKETILLSPGFGIILDRMSPSNPNTPLRAYAKINLGLRITGRRPDGYHTIETVFHRIDLFDEITLARAADIRVESTDPAAPGDASNICHKAARLLQERLGESSGVRCRISKRIPVGAGLGGGSADAAVVLRGLPALWGRGIDDAALHELGLQLGSDVPYFLGTGSAYAQGRGELLEYFPLALPFAICVGYPNIRLSTSWAYSIVTPRGDRRLDLRSALLEGIRTPPLLRESIVNDFEEAVTAHHPAIGELKSSLLRSGALFASMSGSGSSVYGLFSDAHAAEEAARTCRTRGHRAFVTAPGFGA
jgi:4-diphosphocytidyl-2-C-methyl-D-erythritol kinase